jgi:methionine-rich copper-binding protein CopC
VAGHRRNVAVAALGSAVAIAAVLGFAGPAQAHDVLVSSTPASGDVLTALPEAFSVTMNEPLTAIEGSGGFGIQITDAAGRYYGDGCVSLVDATMSMPATLGAAGDYTMVWQLVSADSHPVSSSTAGYTPITFTWQPPADATPSTGSATPPVCGEAQEDPDPTMTTQAEDPAATPAATPVAEAPAGETASTLLWLGGAALAVIVAIGATLLIVRPKKRTPAE